MSWGLTPDARVGVTKVSQLTQKPSTRNVSDMSLLGRLGGRTPKKTLLSGNCADSVPLGAGEDLREAVLRSAGPPVRQGMAVLHHRERVAIPDVAGQRRRIVRRAGLC